MLFSVTYEIVTPESAEDGDAAERGFEMQDVSLREAWEFLRWQGGHCEASDSHILTARWLTLYGEQDYRTGSYTNYSLHLPEGLSQNTRLRIARLFRCHGTSGNIYGRTRDNLR